jgi:hypothetical protein
VYLPLLASSQMIEGADAPFDLKHNPANAHKPFANELETR